MNTASPLAVSTLRGELAGNRAWQADPCRATIIVGGRHQPDGRRPGRCGSHERDALDSGNLTTIDPMIQRFGRVKGPTR